MTGARLLQGRYWQGQFPWPRLAAAELAAALPLLAAWMTTPSADEALVLDVLCPLAEDGAVDGGTVLLLSRRVRPGGLLRCELGFCNRVSHADLLRRNGLPVLEAPIQRLEDGPGLAVAQPLATGAANDALDDWMLRLQGLCFVDEAAPAAEYETGFEQMLLSPAAVRTDDELNQLPLRLSMRRRPALTPAMTPATTPPLAALQLKLRSGPGMTVDLPGVLAATATESGWFRFALDNTERADHAGAAFAAARPLAGNDPLCLPRALGTLRRVRRPAALRPSGFRFEDVELFGFRIDLPATPDTGLGLREMLNGLNFHRRRRGHEPPDGVPTGFDYRVATYSVVIELLRYGRMYWQSSEPRGRPSAADAVYTSQHELLLRVLVGRVDGHSAQARQPAVFVPAIFVDNPWSKLIGRELQGFKKRLARFYAGDQPLSLAGYARPEDGAGLGVGAGVSVSAPRPLSEVTEVRLLQQLECDLQASPAAPLLRLELPTVARRPPAWHHPVDRRTGMRLGAWPQRQFDDELFRRGFAREVLDWGGLPQATIQASPVDGRALPRAWLQGELSFPRLQVRQPDGVAVLRLQAAKHHPAAWRWLAQQMPEGRVALPTGDWYHASGDVNLRLLPGLA